MKRFALLLGATLLMLGVPGSAASAAGTGTCTRRGGGTVQGHPGVVLGPATKCVRGSTSDPVVNITPAGARSDARPDTRSGPVSPGASVPWSVAVIAVGLAGFGALRLRRMRARTDERLAA